MQNAVEARVGGLGGPEAGMPEVERFGARNQISSRTGSISVGLACSHWLTVVEVCGIR
jgi:hypothetical protein